MHFRKVVLLIVTIVFVFSFGAAEAATNDQYQVTVSLDFIKELCTSKEKESETFMEFFVNQRSTVIETWKDQTEEDNSTILRCSSTAWESVDKFGPVDNSITLSVSDNETLEITIKFYEKDGHPHVAAMDRVWLFPEQWNPTKQSCTKWWENKCAKIMHAKPDLCRRETPDDPGYCDQFYDAYFTTWLN